MKTWAKTKQRVARARVDVGSHKPPEELHWSINSRNPWISWCNMDLSFARVFKRRMFSRHLNRLTSYNEGSLLFFAARCCISDRISLLTLVYLLSKINNTTDLKTITCSSEFVQVIDFTYIPARALSPLGLRYPPFSIASFSNTGISLGWEKTLFTLERLWVENQSFVPDSTSKFYGHNVSFMPSVQCCVLQFCNFMCLCSRPQSRGTPACVLMCFPAGVSVYAASPARTSLSVQSDPPVDSSDGIVLSSAFSFFPLLSFQSPFLYMETTENQ